MNGTPSFADPANLEPKRDEAIEVAPDGIHSIFSGPSIVVLIFRYRLGYEPLQLPYRIEHPKLAVTAMVQAVAILQSN